MMLRSMLAVFVLASSSFVSGCAADTAEKDGSSPSSSKMMLTGKVGGASGGTKTQSYGSLSTASGGLHVTAHEVHVRGATVTSGNVDVAVASDGTFNVGLDRGKRWLVTVDDAEGHSAIVTFGNGQNVLNVSANGSTSRVDVGGLSVVGGEARSSFAFDATLGIEATLAGLDDVFEAANGAIIDAREAVKEAQKAAEEALNAANEALDAAEAARKAAEEAAKNAQP